MTPTPFSSETFRRRREEALRELGSGALLLPAASLLHRSRDTEHRYRPDSELFYLTGCTEPGVVALLRGGDTEAPFILFAPERDERAERWSGARPGPRELRERYGADAAYPEKDLEERLPGLLREARRIHFRLGVAPRLQRLVIQALQEARVRGPRKGTGPRAVIDPGEILDELRIRKDPEEVAAIRRAVSLTVAGLREGIGVVRPGTGEWEVEARVDAAFRRGGGTGPAFPTIVGSGTNACVLHYHANADTLAAGSLVLLDAGAELDLYAGDLTRTVPVAGRFTPPQREIHEAVLRAREAALATVRPRSSLEAVHNAAVRALTTGLVELGLLSGSVEGLIARGAHEPWFPHQTSHWLGLDVHDPGDYARRGRPRMLEPGMVLTVEPGLYFPPGLAEGTGAFTGIGVRIEDDVLVTEEGCELLSGDLPVEPEAVAALVGAVSVITG